MRISGSARAISRIMFTRTTVLYGHVTINKITPIELRLYSCTKGGTLVATAELI